LTVIQTGHSICHDLTLTCLLLPNQIFLLRKSYIALSKSGCTYPSTG